MAPSSICKYTIHTINVWQDLSAPSAGQLYWSCPACPSPPWVMEALPNFSSAPQGLGGEGRGACLWGYGWATTTCPCASANRGKTHGWLREPKLPLLPCVKLLPGSAPAFSVPTSPVPLQLPSTCSFCHVLKHCDGELFAWLTPWTCLLLWLFINPENSINTTLKSKYFAAGQI